MAKWLCGFWLSVFWAPSSRWLSPAGGSCYLFRLITSGQPAPDRVVGVTKRLGRAVATQVVEVFGQKKLLKWSIPGAAHFFVFWAFLILGTVYLEAYGILLSRNEHWAIPIVGHWDLLGFAQDLIALMCLLGIGTFALIRMKESPGRLGRKSRFSGSHTGGAWLVLFMIFNVIWTLFLFRGAAAAATTSRTATAPSSRRPSARSFPTPRPSRASACCSTSASCWCSWSTSCTPSTSTSSWRR